MDIHVEPCQLLPLNAPLTVGAPNVVFVVLPVAGVATIPHLLSSFVGPHDAILHRPDDVRAVAVKLDLRRMDLMRGFGLLHGPADQPKRLVAAMDLVSSGRLGIEQQVLGENISVPSPILAIEGPAIAGLGFADRHVVGKVDLRHVILSFLSTPPSKLALLQSSFLQISWLMA